MADRTRSPLERVLDLYDAQHIYVWEIQAKNNYDNQIYKFYTANVEGFTTSPDDKVAPNKSFMSRLLDDFNFTFSAGSGDTFSGFEGIANGEIVLDISDLNDELKFLKDVNEWTIYGQYATLYFGSDIDPDQPRTRMPFDKFTPVYYGKILSAPMADSKISVKLDDMNSFLGDKVADELFRSIGQGIEFKSTNYGFVYRDQRSSLEGKEFTLGMYFEVLENWNHTEPLALVSRGELNGKANYGIYISSVREIGIKSRNQILWSPPGSFELNKLYSLFVVKKVNLLQVFLEGELLFEANFSDPKNYAESDNIYFNLSSLNNAGHIRLYEFITFDTALTYIEMNQFNQGPFPKASLLIDTNITAVRRSHWKFEYTTFLNEIEPFVLSEVPFGNGQTAMDLYIYNIGFPVISNNSFEFDRDKDTIENGRWSEGNTIIGWTPDDPTKVGRLRIAETSYFDNRHTDYGETVAFIQNRHTLTQMVYFPAGNYTAEVWVNSNSAGGARFLMEVNGIEAIPSTVLTPSTAGNYNPSFTHLSNTFTVATAGVYPVTLWQRATSDGSIVLIDRVFINKTSSPFGPPDIVLISSNEGNDPDLYSSGLLGQVKPLIYGNPRNLPLIWTDDQFGFGILAKKGEISDVTYGRIEGYPLVQYIQETIPKIEIYEHDSSIRLKGVVPSKVQQLIPAQTNPTRPGQTFNLTPGGSNTSDYVIASFKNNVIIADSTHLSTEVLTNNVITSVDWKWKFNNSNDTLELPDMLGTKGQITFDIVGTKQYKASQIIAEILNKYYEKDKVPYSFVIDNQLTFDPVLDLYIKDQSREEVLNKVLDSCFGYMFRLPDGRIRLANYAPPAREPDFVIEEYLLDDSFLNEGNSINPYWQIQVGYAFNNTVQGDDKLNELLTVPDKRYYGNDYLWQPLPDYDIKKKFPDSGILQVETYLRTRADAIILGTLLYRVYKNKLLMYNVSSVRNFGKMIYPGQTVRVVSNTLYTRTYRDLVVKKSTFNETSDSWSLSLYGPESDPDK